MRVDALDDLAVELHDQPQDAVRGGVLGPEIDRVIADLVVAGVARVAELGPFADRADVDFDLAGAGAGVGHAHLIPSPRRGEGSA